MTSPGVHLLGGARPIPQYPIGKIKEWIPAFAGMTEETLDT